MQRSWRAGGAEGMAPESRLILSSFPVRSPVRSPVRQEQPCAKRSALIPTTSGDARASVSVKTSGFTLIEIMVVMALMALLVGLVPIAFGRLSESAQYRETVRAILTDMRTARYLAQSGGSDVRFAVNLNQRSFGVEGRKRHTVPEPLQIRAVMAQQESGADGDMAIRFLSTGGASGGSVDLLRPSGGGVRLRVDWFSGRVEQESVGP